MAGQYGWVLDPNAGGTKIPDRLKAQVTERIEALAAQHFKGKYARLDIRFKGQFCYIGTLQEPQVPENFPPPDWGITREEYLERMRNTPMPLCRLRHFSADRWSFGFYTHSNEKYELCLFDTGGFFGKPEDAFLQAGRFYLS